MITFALAATALVAWAAAPQAEADVNPPGGQLVGRAADPTMGPARKLLQSPELEELLLVQARNADMDAQQLSEAELRTGVRQLMDDFAGLVDDHLDENAREALQAAHLDDDIFTHLRKIFYVLRDPRLVQLGR